MFKKMLLGIGIILLFKAITMAAPVMSTFEYNCTTTTIYVVNVSSYANTTIPARGGRSVLVITADKDNAGRVNVSNDTNILADLDNGLAAEDQAVERYYTGAYYLRAQAGNATQRIIIQETWRN